MPKMSYPTMQPFIMLRFSRTNAPGEPLMIIVHTCTLSLNDELRANSSIGMLEIKEKVQT